MQAQVFYAYSDHSLKQACAKAKGGDYIDVTADIHATAVPRVVPGARISTRKHRVTCPAIIGGRRRVTIVGIGLEFLDIEAMIS